jgi:hypothetical protein
MPPTHSREINPRIDPTFIEAQRNRYASRNLAYLILLNGAAALVLLTAVARAPESPFQPKLAEAMMVFGSGAVVGLLSSFVAYVNRTLSMEAQSWPGLRNILLALSVLAALAGGAAFLTGLSMVWNVSASSSSHPKSGLQKQAPAPAEPQTSPSAAAHIDGRAAGNARLRI